MPMVSSDYHIPVLRDQALEGLAIKPDGVYVDATFGGGGHAMALLDQLGPEGRLMAFDKDADSKGNQMDDPRFTLINHDYAFLKNFIQYLEADPVDGILADLGVSSFQIDTGKRGFTYRENAPLDMRMDQEASLTAKQVLNTYSEAELHRVLGQYGEIKNARQLAEAIVEQRQQKAFETSSDLLAVLEHTIHKQDKAKQYQSQVFQALRIEVNEELERLKTFLEKATEVLKEGGRLVVITYHSLEDRIVKNYFRTGNFQGKPEKDFYGNVLKPLEVVNRKPIEPSEAEQRSNPRSRSAKMRIAVKKAAA